MKNPILILTTALLFSAPRLGYARPVKVHMYLKNCTSALKIIEVRKRTPKIFGKGYYWSDWGDNDFHLEGRQYDSPDASNCPDKARNCYDRKFTLKKHQPAMGARVRGKTQYALLSRDDKDKNGYFIITDEGIERKNSKNEWRCD